LEIQKESQRIDRRSHKKETEGATRRDRRSHKKIQKDELQGETQRESQRRGRRSYWERSSRLFGLVQNFLLGVGLTGLGSKQGNSR
jgi:hypothetical protein